MIRFFYNILFACIVIPAARLLSLVNPKVAHSFRERRQFSVRHIAAQIAQLRAAKPGSPAQHPRSKHRQTLWFHASSVGEFEQVKTVINLIRNQTDSFIVVSYYSPSARPSLEKFAGAHMIFPLPWDLPGRTRKLVEIIAADYFICAKYDAWLNLLHYLKARGSKLLLMSATIHRAAGRLRRPAVPLTRVIFNYFDYIGTATIRDSEIITNLLVGGPRIEVLGDGRFDAIFERFESFKSRPSDITQTINRLRDKRPYLVVGSSYKESEEACVYAWQELKKKGLGLRVIFVPHETDAKNIGRLTAFLQTQGIRPTVYQSGDKLTDFDDFLIIAAHGILADLYSVADLVLVGGSFHYRVHSIGEACVHAKPILTGPLIDNSPEGVAMAEAGVIRRCTNRRDFTEALTDLLSPEGGEAARQAMAEGAYGYILARRGAGSRFFKVLVEYGLEPTA